jgi:hypothetical protein
MNKYFYTDGTTKFGPFSKEELRKQKILRSTKIWFYGMDKWKELSEILELNDLTTAIPPDIKTKHISAKITKITKINEISEISEISEIKPAVNERSIKQPTKNKKTYNITKWLIGAVAVLFISFLAYSSIESKPDVNLYNEIVANSYDSDENFEMYVEKFYRDLEYFGVFPKKPKKTIIKLSKLDQLDNLTHIHGLSFAAGNDDKIEIYINPSTWKKFNKPMRYFLMYHELAHDILNVADLKAISANEGKLMYPEISSYENKNMDDFIESSHALFEEQSTK